MWWLIIIAVAVDVVIFAGEAITVMVPSGFLSLIVDEVVEFFVSNLIAKNKLKLKDRYKIVGLLPIPGLTSVSLQASLALIQSYRKPEKVLELMAESESK